MSPGVFLALFLGLDLVIYGLFSWISNIRENKKNSKFLKTKLLKKMRAYGRNKVGVFIQDDGRYTIVYDRNKLSPYVNDYMVNSDRLSTDFEIIDSNIPTIDAARILCEKYRRHFILKRVREKRYGNCDRIY